MLTGHGGSLPEKALRAGVRPEEITDFSVSVNPRLNPDLLRPQFERALSAVNRYPDPHYAELRGAISKKYGLVPENIVAGNGSTELIYLVPRAFAPKSALVVAPSYADYADSARMAGAEVRRFFLEEKERFRFDEKKFLAEARSAEMVFVGNPNNPTGGVIEKDAVLRVVDERPDVLFVVDESFADYAPEISLLGSLRPNLVVIRSFTKFYGAPGLRLGFSASAPETTKKILSMKEPWSVNCVAEAFATSVLAEPDEFAAGLRDAAASDRDELAGSLGGIKALDVFHSRANFLLVKIRDRLMTTGELQAELLRRKMLVRDCSNFEGLEPYYFRVGLRTRGENAMLAAALKEIFPA
jgi:L-threonine-O-3-phosphate decarboxylase